MYIKRARIRNPMTAPMPIPALALVERDWLLLLGVVVAVAGVAVDNGEEEVEIWKGWS